MIAEIRIELSKHFWTNDKRELTSAFYIHTFNATWEYATM